MAQFCTQRNKLLNNNNTIYEVVMVSGQAGPSVYVPAGNLNAASDAFGRLRQSTPYTIFDSSHEHRSEFVSFNEQVAGSASVAEDGNQAAVLLEVTGAAGDEVIRQSRRYMSYQPGKSLLTLSTMVFSAPLTGLRQRVGYFDNHNGVFLEQDDNTVYMVQRSYASGSLIERRIAQADWNVDRMDGTGPSGVTLDLTKSQIYWMDIEWLGVGSVRTGFAINGQFIACHAFHNANIRDEVYMSTANLPVRYEITNTGATGVASTMKQICSSVISEGGYEPRALEHMQGSSVTSPTTLGNSGNWTNLVTISMANPGDIVILAGSDVMNLDNANLEWGLFFNATPSSPFVYTDTYNRIEYTTQNTTLTDPGRRIAGGYIASKTAPASLGTLNWDYQLGQQVDGTSDTVTLAVKGGNNNDVAGLIKWFEP